jgi:alginate O-acetyltransferase complex protein AlgI
MPVFQSSTASTAGISLNSWEFLVISAVAVILSSLVGRGLIRHVALLALNLWVLATFLPSLASAIILALFLVTSYAIGLWRRRLGRQFSMTAQLCVVAGLWVFLFLVRDPNLLAPANPFHLLPVQIVGISYMTFRSISYLMEIEFIEHPSFLRFCVYVLFFPTLLAGPIERYKSFEGQLAAPSFAPDLVMPALHRIANGFIKKFVIADNLSVFGIFSFDKAADVSTPMLWVGALSQLALIYVDFSGYCDIVIGVASLMGFRIIENFNRPFSSTSIQEFWNRWHISLSTLVRDYIFSPINMIIIKRAKRKIQFALITIVYFFSMILIGLWHGVSWGFVAFGSIHGAALVGSQLLRKYRGARPPAVSLPTIYLQRFLVYSFVSITLILWLKSYSEWGRIYAKLLGFGP